LINDCQRSSHASHAGYVQGCTTAHHTAAFPIIRNQKVQRHADSPDSVQGVRQQQAWRSVHAGRLVPCLQISFVLQLALE
jgi:hypothetical protein